MVAGITFATQAVQMEAAVTAGGLAIIGFTDNRTNGDPLADTFTMVALEEIAASTVVYFTDNGWIQADNKFRGADAGGAGSETLLKLTFTSSVAAGTIMRSGVDDSGNFSWDVSTLIPGDNDEYFSLLNLDSNTDPSNPIGDQIYIFQTSSSTLPLSSFSDPLNPGNAIYLLDLGDYMNPGFEDAETSSQGNILPGLSAVPNTAWILPELDPNDDPNLFHNGSFALNLNLQPFMDLQAAGGSKAEWLAYIANPLHWGRSEFHVDDNPDPDLEDDLMNFGFINGGLNVLGIPEPSRALLIGLAFVGAVLRRRRE
jgi:hypothetical protein